MYREGAKIPITDVEEKVVEEMLERLERGEDFGFTIERIELNCYLITVGHFNEKFFLVPEAMV